MNDYDLTKLTAEESNWNRIEAECYEALTALYSKPHTPKPGYVDSENFAIVHYSIQHLRFELDNKTRELEKIKNRTFVEKLKDLFRK